MPLFNCSNCGVIENTALCRYWYTGKDKSAPRLCSECDQSIGKWHGRFPRAFEPVAPHDLPFDHPDKAERPAPVQDEGETR